ncbi:uncharacterized protein LOC141907296 [Tubulanus polymorphus]|uniref:uncharacterized protein LOC141907296 n=1 Tax=Tubulanus polymorphus TaxID=672921 RepID=UPI003DA3A551
MALVLNSGGRVAITPCKRKVGPTALQISSTAYFSVEYLLICKGSTYTIPEASELVAWQYTTRAPDSEAVGFFATIWRPFETNRYRLITKQFLNVTRDGKQSHALATPVKVEKGDLIGMHTAPGVSARLRYSQQSRSISNDVIMSRHIQDDKLPVDFVLTSPTGPTYNVLTSILLGLRAIVRPLDTVICERLFNAEENFHLKPSVPVHEEIVTSSLQCALLCMDNGACESFHTWSDGSGSLNCELNGFLPIEVNKVVTAGYLLFS